MDRRSFVSRVTLGAAALCTSTASRSAAAATGGLRLHFVGMMGFVGRSDGSYLVATPGRQAHPHLNHRPFLMARRASAAQAAFDMQPAIGVIPSAFDMRLSNERASDFVYRCLENTSLDIVSGSEHAVENVSTQMAQMAKIAPGKRVRGDIERWSPTTVSLRGGRLSDSAAHPDAGKTWVFGEYRQRLTDAVDFTGAAGTVVRLTTGGEARTLESTAAESADLWLISAALPSNGFNNPRCSNTVRSCSTISSMPGRSRSSVRKPRAARCLRQNFPVRTRRVRLWVFRVAKRGSRRSQTSVRRA